MSARAHPATRLTAADRERLRAATGRRMIDAGDSLFGPGSASWRVDREAALLLGGGRALLMQVAHPLVAAGVAAHSRFRAEPAARLWRTLDLMLTIVFADAAGAMAAVRQIEGVHARVRGVLDADVGPFPRGTAYEAGDPELLLWVHATLIDSALATYERFVGRLTDGERAAFYDESKVTARLLGVPDQLLPGDVDELREYVAAMIASDVLTVGATGLDVGASVLSPPVSRALGPAVALARFITVGLLPSALRDRYGLVWSDRREALLSALAAVVRRGLPLLPSYLRDMPHARRAGRRPKPVADPLPARAPVW